MRAKRAGWARKAGAIGVALMALFARAAHAELTPLEVAVKATYLYKLAPFISWPPSAFSGPNAPLTICVQGTDPFGSLLDRAVGGQSAGSHPIIVRRTPQIDPGLGCHIAYLGGGPTQSVADALRALARTPTVTVTDEARGGPRGVVHLMIEDGHIRFALDALQARANDVALSSKLMALAVEVRR